MKTSELVRCTEQVFGRKSNYCDKQEILREMQKVNEDSTQAEKEFVAKILKDNFTAFGKNEFIEIVQQFVIKTNFKKEN